MDLENKKTNRALLIGWTVIVAVLFIMYLMEVLRGARTLPYMIAFSAITIIPNFFCVLLFKRTQTSRALPYLIVAGYMLMYGFVLFTGSTTLVFTYILPMLSLLVLYHNPRLILVSGAGTLILNIISILYNYKTGVIEDIFDKDVRIQVALLALCFTELFYATKIYNEIYNNNIDYNRQLSDQKEELLRQAAELETVNSELDKKSKELEVRNEQLREMTMQTIMTIANTIDAKDEYTKGHSRRVAEYSVAIAHELGSDDEELNNIRFIGLLHDIGKIGVPDNVLNKPGKLTDEEYRLMKDHTVIGGEILKDITLIEGLDTGAKFHHERYDGKGYPEGLKGEEIPRIARIVGVADAYDAMTSNRVYRKHLDDDRVMNELKKGRGTQFDPLACDTLIRLIEEKRLPKMIPDESMEVRQATKILTRVIDKAEETALEDVHYDDLTGTLARENGIRMLQGEIGKYGTGMMFVFDIDNFRRLNEKEGFAVGDRYLMLVADEIRMISDKIMISRFGSDEFAAYLPELKTKADAERAAKAFIMRIRRIARNNKIFSTLSVSIGITPVYTEKDRVMVLYEYANKALFVAKQNDPGSFYIHKPEFLDEDEVAAANSADLKLLVSALEDKGGDGLAGDVGNAGIAGVKKAYDAISDEIRGRASVVLFTLRWTDPDEFTPDGRNEVMGLLEQAISRAVGANDLFTRYSNVQYALIVAGTTDQQLHQTVNRIMTSFYRINTARGVEVHYDIANLG